MENDKTSVDLNGNGMNSGAIANTVGGASARSAKTIGVGAATGIGVVSSVVGAGGAAIPFFAFARNDGSDPAQEAAQAAEDVASQTEDVATAQTEEVVNADAEGTMETASEAASDVSSDVSSDIASDAVFGTASDAVSEHVAVASDLTLANNVTDDMTFSEAFAAARSEVGPGGIFYYHGNAYGTYYETEWNNMSEDDKADYWASVSHTVSEHPYEYHEPTVEPELITDFTIDDIEEISLAGAITVDANRNDDPDVIVDLDGDGVGDVLLVDVKMDEEGNVLSVGDAMEGHYNYLGGLEDDESEEDYEEEDYSDYDEEEDDDDIFGDESDTAVIDDMSDDVSYNMDYDYSADTTLDPDAFIDNNVDTTDMV